MHADTRHEDVRSSTELPQIETFQSDVFVTLKPEQTKSRANQAGDQTMNCPTPQPFNPPTLRRFHALTLLLLFLALAWSGAAATLNTDKPDYPPGATVVITGDGWLPWEAVQLQVLHAAGGDDATSPTSAHAPWNVTADENGKISSSWYIPTDEDELGATL